MKLRLHKNILELLEGAVDIHIHSAPDVYPRLLNDIDLAVQAREMGMRAILLKNHFFETASRAQVAGEVAEFPVFGGVALNLSVGGVNHHAVRAALGMGAKAVWAPTLHARNFLANKSHLAGLAGQIGADVSGVYLLNEDGSLMEEMYPIFDLIIEHDSFLATGHVSMDEARVLVKEAAEYGVRKIVVTHPMASFVNHSVPEMKELLDLGATFLEHVYNDTTRGVSHPLDREKLCEGIKATGPDHCIISTDAGQWVNPAPVHQMGLFIGDLLNFGFSAKEIRRMASENPSSLLGLS